MVPVVGAAGATTTGTGSAFAAGAVAAGFFAAGAGSTGGALTAGAEGAARAGVDAGTGALTDAGLSGRGWVANQVYAPRAARPTATSATTIRLGTHALH
jgi:hypothetical protein